MLGSPSYYILFDTTCVSHEIDPEIIVKLTNLENMYIFVIDKRSRSGTIMARKFLYSLLIYLDDLCNQGTSTIIIWVLLHSKTILRSIPENYS